MRDDGGGRAKARGEGREVVVLYEGKGAIECLKGLSGFWERRGALLCVVDGDPDRGMKVANHAPDGCGGQCSPEAWL